MSDSKYVWHAMRTSVPVKRALLRNRTTKHLNTGLIEGGGTTLVTLDDIKKGTVIGVIGGRTISKHRAWLGKRCFKMHVSALRTMYVHIHFTSQTEQQHEGVGHGVSKHRQHGYYSSS